MRALLTFAMLLLRCVPAIFRSRREQAVVELALRQQLTAYANDSIFLQRLLCEYVAYYNADRVHTQLRDSPAGREVEARPSPTAQVVGLPRVGGLHHRYVWREVA